MKSKETHLFVQKPRIKICKMTKEMWLKMMTIRKNWIDPLNTGDQIELESMSNILTSKFPWIKCDKVHKTTIITSSSTAYNWNSLKMAAKVMRMRKSRTGNMYSGRGTVGIWHIYLFVAWKDILDENKYICYRRKRHIIYILRRRERG